ncbi:VOC family protein [Flavisolibacter nicotianae]|uniref:VOC family protein n=1 Tax=Flavisolibacter nicotianae TaxID=2364882 RepID=UPI000EAEBA1F|nr:VOC family protein [Flavisolibacter nicotianae]
MQIIPYIIFKGNCEEALKFYGKALGGETGPISRYADAPENPMGMDPDNVMHTHFVKDGNVLFMASDGPVDASDSGIVSLSLDFKDSGSIQSAFAALSDGGKVTMPLQDTFWGATFGMLQDQYGVKWMFNYDKPKK